MKIDGWRKLVSSRPLRGFLAVTVGGNAFSRRQGAIHDGLVWYDPADSIYSSGEAKVRPQWRTSASRLEATMTRLYSASRRIPVLRAHQGQA